MSKCVEGFVRMGHYVGKRGHSTTEELMFVGIQKLPVVSSLKGSQVANERPKSDEALGS